VTTAEMKSSAVPPRRATERQKDHPIDGSTSAVGAKLRYVDPTRPPGSLARAYAAFAASRVARFISRHINWKIDPLLLRATRGRLATTLVFPTAVLETRGARTGVRRRHAIIYFHDGDRVTIAASNAGSSTHPGWYHNLRAHPDVTFGGIPMRATVVDDQAERERLWVLADRVFPAFPRYRHDAAKANRTIPVIHLLPRDADAASQHVGL
jgi:deazaflavin-dependent oxidoreductase (nitroreductase family)